MQKSPNIELAVAGANVSTSSSQERVHALSKGRPFGSDEDGAADRATAIGQWENEGGAASVEREPSRDTGTGRLRLARKVIARNRRSANVIEQVQTPSSCGRGASERA